MKTFFGNVYQLELSELTQLPPSSFTEWSLLALALHCMNVGLLHQF